MPKHTDFRIWLQRMWADHKAEMENWTGSSVEYPMEQYLLKYKWWLKTIYKKEKLSARSIDTDH